MPSILHLSPGLEQQAICGRVRVENNASRESLALT